MGQRHHMYGHSGAHKIHKSRRNFIANLNVTQDPQDQLILRKWREEWQAEEK